MQTAACTFFILLALLALHQVVVAVIFAVLVRSASRQPLIAPENRLPKAALLMGLRGADPFLLESLKRLFTQDYPGYEALLAAWSVIEQAIQETKERREPTGPRDEVSPRGAQRIQLVEHVLAPPDGPAHGIANCTNSKVVQLLRTLDADVEIVAMADADLMPHPTWLKELVSPLADDPRTGAAFGNRWFIPRRGRLGSLIRHTWNAGAVVGMYLMNMPWGGCIAIRHDAIRRGHLVDEWAKVIALDANTPRQLKALGLQTRFVPQLMMPNYEECSLPFVVNFVQRQLTWTRMYHGEWPMIVVHVTLNVVGVVGSLALAMYLAIAGLAGWAWLPILGLGVYLAGLYGGAAVIAWGVSAALERQQVAKVRLSAPRLAKLALAVPLGHLFHALAALRATFSRRVRWRGITLELKGGTLQMSQIEQSEKAQGDQSL